MKGVPRLTADRRIGVADEHGRGAGCARWSCLYACTLARHLHSGDPKLHLTFEMPSVNGTVQQSHYINLVHRH